MSRNDKRPEGASQRAALAARISRQVAHDRDHSVAPPVTLPKLSCLDEEPPDGEHPERAA